MQSSWQSKVERSLKCLSCEIDCCSLAWIFFCLRNFGRWKKYPGCWNGSKTFNANDIHPFAGCRSVFELKFSSLANVIFVVLSCHSSVLDGFDRNFQGSVHFTLGSAVNKSLQHLKIPEKNSQECWESNPGLLGEKQKRYLCAIQSPYNWPNVWFTPVLKSTAQDPNPLKNEPHYTRI